MTEVQVPPQNIVAEESVLGAMLVAEPAVTRVIDEVRLTAADFYLDRHRVIFAAIRDLYAASKPVDELTIADALGRSGSLDAAGGKHYISELAATVPAAGNATHYAEIVQRTACERVEGAERQEVAKGLLDGLPATDAIEQLRALRRRAGGPVDGAYALSLGRIERENIDWLWPGRVPMGMLTLLIGDPGLGKSLLTVDLAARVSRAGADVLMLSAEDHAGATIRPRAEAADADLDRVHVVGVRRDGLEEGIALPNDAGNLDRLVAEYGARLVVIDPLTAHLPESVNSWRDQSVRRALAPLNRLAKDRRCAVIVVGHLNKAQGADPLYRTGGSIAIPAAVRSALLLARDPEDPDGARGSQRVLAHTKCNVAPLAESVVCQIETVELNAEIKTARLRITAGTSSIAARDLLEAPTEKHTERDDATEFLIKELREGPRPVKELKEAAGRAKLAWRTVERAKEGLPIEARKGGFREGWVWSLPEDREDRQPEDRHSYISDLALFGVSLRRAKNRRDPTPKTATYPIWRSSRGRPTKLALSPRPTRPPSSPRCGRWGWTPSSSGRGASDHAATLHAGGGRRPPRLPRAAPTRAPRADRPDDV